MIDLPIDYEHQADDPAHTASGPIPAAGWITRLELRSDGIWGHVKWTSTASTMIEKQEYRYISPTFKYNAVTRKVLALSGAGLVHKPNLHLTALASEELTMSHEETALCAIAAALGLSKDAGEETIIRQIENLNQSAPDPAKYVPIEAVSDLMQDRGSKMALARESDVEATVNHAMDHGYITPGMRDWATALCRQDPDSFAEFTNSAAPAYAHLFKSQLESNTIPDPKSRAIDETELAICAQLDIDPQTLLES